MDPINLTTEQDRSWRSRKFMLANFCLLLISAITVFSVWFVSLHAILPSFIGGILGVLSLYYGGNVGSKFVIGKTQVEISKHKQATPQQEQK